MRETLLPWLLAAGTAFSQSLERHVEATDLRDPMEMELAPDGDLYVVEREGRVLRVRPGTGGVFVVGQLEVTALRASNPQSNYAREDGLQGIALDPGFAENRTLYLYYSHPQEMVNRLSRFQLKDGLLDPASERKILDVPMDRDRRVCHHGGAVEFGPDGLLYLSTGDNTNPFESSGRAPLDDRPDRAHADAMRTAGNTNDLRGKILRIRITDEGYEIPEGNLFPPGTENTRPEIYIMGCRNPFRISLDEKTGTLYWGDIGPDAGEPSPKGPRGHDEVNQAKQAGNFGWPFVIADNQPYPIVDFETGEPGAMIDPSAPVNPGHRNTGLRELPPAHPAFIWYPYATTDLFPTLGSGGRNAMAGPVVRYDESRTFNILAPADDPSLIVYDWIRGKLWKAKLGGNEELESLETLAGDFVHPMDLKMGPDGSLWLLEYGKEWWFNTDGKILRLRPEGSNRPPTLAIERSTENPAEFSAIDVSDPEGDSVTITWWATEGHDERNLGTGSRATIGPETTEIRAVARDSKGAFSVARFRLTEEPANPPLEIEIAGKPDALGVGEEFGFKISGGNGSVDPSEVLVRARYIALKGHDAGGPAFPNDIAELVTERQCFACHQMEQASVGPRYIDVAMRYREQADAAEFLAGKVKSGGGGVWGEIPMPPQVAMSDEETARVVAAILALSEGVSEYRGAPEGRLQLSAGTADAAPGGAWEITAEAKNYPRARIRIPAR